VLAEPARLGRFTQFFAGARIRPSAAELGVIRRSGLADSRSAGVEFHSMNAPLPGVVLDVPATGGELSLGMFVGAECVADLTADAGSLEALEAELGMRRADVRALSFTALRMRRDRELPALLMTAPRASTRVLERFVSLYLHSVGEHTRAGCVWYDVASSTTGPSGVPNAVRNQVRFLVNQSLAGGRLSPALLDALLHWDATRLEATPPDKTRLEPAAALESASQAVDVTSAVADAFRTPDALQPLEGMTILESFDDAHGSVVIGWLVPGVLYARFAGNITLALGREYVRRLRTLVAGQEGVQYFTDYGAIESYEVRVFPIILVTLKELQGHFGRVVALPWATAPTANAQERLDAVAFLEFVATAEEFEARLRSAAPFRGLTSSSPERARSSARAPEKYTVQSSPSPSSEALDRRE
jgi:hypothetical protein